MSKKNGLQVYLAGAMEVSADLGAGWRSEITPFFNEFGHTVQNPCDFEPAQLKGLHINRLPETLTTKEGKIIKPKHWHELKHSTNQKDFNRFLTYMRRVINYDIRLIRNEIDYIVVYWNEDTAKGAGTHSELTEGFMNNIPIYCVTDTVMPAWAMACCTHRFNNFDELKEKLVEDFGE